MKEAKKLIAYEEELLTHAKRGQAYGTVAKQTASPRDLEADLLLKAASRLQAVHDKWDNSARQLDAGAALQPQALVDLHDLGDQHDNPLPAGVRQNVANIGMFVMNQTMSMMTDPKREKLAAPDQHQSRARRRTARQRA